jgi:glycosyltransferase involved in cell wall biosynthesis
MVSILIPVFNAENFLLETIQSAMNQSYENIEIIAVDDGSTDNSLEILKSIQDKRFKFYSQENKGASAARNLAFEKSSGTFIQYLDADDILDKDKILNQMKSSEKYADNTIFSGNFYYFKRTVEDKFSSKLPEGHKNYENPIDWLIDAANDKAMFPPICWLTPRKLIEKAGLWNENLSYNDDSEFFAKVIIQAGNLTHCPDSICYYRTGNLNSYGSQRSENAIKSELKSLVLVKNHLIGQRVQSAGERGDGVSIF